MIIDIDIDMTIPQYGYTIQLLKGCGSEASTLPSCGVGNEFELRELFYCGWKKSCIS